LYYSFQSSNFSFPYNLEDRIKHIINLIAKEIDKKPNFTIKEKNIKNVVADNLTISTFTLEFTDLPHTTNLVNISKKYNGKYYEKEKKWIFIIE
jgi:hypothetical protein